MLLENDIISCKIIYIFSIAPTCTFLRYAHLNIVVPLTNYMTILRITIKYCFYSVLVAFSLFQEKLININDQWFTIIKKYKYKNKFGQNSMKILHFYIRLQYVFWTKISYWLRANPFFTAARPQPKKFTDWDTIILRQWSNWMLCIRKGRKLAFLTSPFSFKTNNSLF